jgi:anti-sigma-K factor RskA
VADHVTWDSTRDWLIQRSHHYQVALVVVFQSAQPSLEELAHARKLRPEFSNEPPKTFRRRILNGRLDLGVLPAVEARATAALASALGLTLEPKATTQTVYLFKDRAASAVLIVEDQEESERVASEMLAAGVPMVDVEVD